ncbi:MAG: Ger(x)C family spore germination protein [Clostridia bacterium]|nr:Ger(x)C family spore germination protein [Ruminiclostridium sp.]MBQ3537043.1 Ger(x)C family spore germination protein [Clostridia bacterium]
MKKISIAFILSLVLSLSLSGCVRYVELSDRAIVQALGIDYIPDRNIYRISMQYFSQTSEGGQNQIDKTQPNVLKSVGEGDSILTAAKNASILSGKDLLLSENRLIIIGSELCNEDLSKTLQFFISNYHSHPKTYVCGAENTAEELIDIRFKEGYVSSQRLINLIENASSEGHTVADYAYQIMSSLCNSTGSAYLPRLKISEQKTDGTVPKESGEGQKGGEEEQEAEKTIVLDGGVVFSDKRKSGVIDSESCVGLQFLSNRMAEYSVTVKDNDNRSTITFFSVRTAITPKFNEKSELYFDISVTADGRFDERGGISETDTARIMAVKSKAEQEVTALMEKAATDIRENCRSDIFGLEKALRHHYPGFVARNKDNITDILLSAPCIIKVKCNTFSLGLESY